MERIHRLAMGTLDRMRAALVPALAAGVIVCLGAASAAAFQASPLGELAKKEEARRKGITTPSKVYTNKDLPKSQPPVVPVPAPAPADQKAAEEKKQADAQKPAEEVKDENWWRTRMTNARTELQRSEMALEAFQSRVNALTNDFAARDDPYQRAQISIDRQKALNEMERVRSDIERYKQQIADIEEEARVAGVPPGWLR